MPAPAFDLYLITDPVFPGRLVDRVAAALKGCRGQGARVAVQLRAKRAPSGELLATARTLRKVTRDVGSALLINDRPDIAQLCQADGVHLPERGMEVADARQCLPEGALVGVSCHDANGLQRATQAGADFATVSPVHGVPGKSAPLGHAGFKMLAASTQLPLYALGGVATQDVAPLVTAGARGIAVIRSVFASPTPARETARFLERFPQAPIPGGD